MAKIVQLNVRVPEKVRDEELKTLKAQVQPLVPPGVKKPSEDDIVGILIHNAKAVVVAKAAHQYFVLKDS
jgi:hypothetical protein